MAETKYAERRIVINKFIKEKTLMGSSEERKPQRKVVRIAYSDHNATDSSGDEEEGDRSRGVLKKNRVKRIVTEVRIVECDDPAARKLNARTSGRSKKKQNGVLVKRNDGTGKNFKGVRQRQWGRWAAEIRNPFSKGRIWLGTYDTAEEAAMAYDKKSIELRGSAAFTNLIKPVPEPQKPLSPCPSPPPEVDVGTASCDLDKFVLMNNEPSNLDSGVNFDYDSGFESQALRSPTSVLRFQPVELGVESMDTREWKPIEDFSEADGSVLEDQQQFFSGWLDIGSETPLPTFYDEIRGPCENFSDISLVSHQDFTSCTWEDFTSCTWEVDQYFEDEPEGTAVKISD